MININSSFPKVLIIGETFRYTGGGGITLINLFKDWDPENIAVITERISETSSQVVCKKFYRLGELEINIPFPFSRINKFPSSGDIKIEGQAHTKDSQKTKRKFKQSLKFILEKTYYKTLVLLGIYHFFYKITISKLLLDWINEYSPDIIYAQPFRYADMQFIYELHKKTSIPLAIHIMDDSISFLNKPNLLYFYWRKKTQNVFQKLIDSSVILMSISQFMSDEYYKRYNKIFIPIRNPIELIQWLPYVRKEWKISNSVNIIYTGRLAVPNINTLFRFSKVVDNLNKIGLNIKFDIFSIDNNPQFIKNIMHFTGVQVKKAIPYEEIPKLIPKYDIVLLPIDFNKKGIKYAKYSISTKTSEYMISGVPILLIAPKEVALTHYAIEKECMLSVIEDNYKSISAGLVKLIDDEKLRESLAKTAYGIAKIDSDAIKVRQEFQSHLNFITNS